MKLSKVASIPLDLFGIHLCRLEKYERAVKILAIHSGLRPEDAHSKLSTGIVFSKDRAMQLHALLSSYYQSAAHPAPLHVLYQTSDGRHENSYDELKTIFKKNNVTFTKQKDGSHFKSDLLTILNGITTAKMFFLVDDIIFVRRFDLEDMVTFDLRSFIPSLRLGDNIAFTYVSHKAIESPSELPEIIQAGDKKCWSWINSSRDWNYPLSVDGHIYLTREMQLIAEECSFTAPNTFEIAMQEYRDFFKCRYGVCYKKSAVVNSPWNEVQNELNNLSGKISSEYLLDKWNAGFVIDTAKYRNFIPESVHQELELVLTERKSAERPEFSG